MTIEEKRDALRLWCDGQWAKDNACGDCPLTWKGVSCYEHADVVDKNYAIVFGDDADKSAVKGVSPDAPIVTNAQGGMQSKTEYAFHLIDTDAILSLAEVLQIGANKYARDNWRNIPSEEHFNHMMIHYYAWQKGDKSDDHLGHLLCRAMMLYATGKAVSD